MPESVGIEELSRADLSQNDIPGAFGSFLGDPPTILLRFWSGILFLHTRDDQSLWLRTENAPAYAEVCS